MANEEQLAILRQGVEVWNKWREESLHAGFRIIDQKVTDLIEADFTNAQLSGADLSRADLSRANLSGADLQYADLSGANLLRADLSRVNLLGADLTGTNLKETKLSSALIGSTRFGYVDLRWIIGLNEVRHLFPSTVGTDTITISKGNIPEVFLMGCGLSDWEIEETKLYNPGLSNEEINRTLYKIYDLRASQALQISPLFISYSHTDEVFVNKICAHLDKNGIRYWRDIHKATAGPLEQQVDKAIRQNPTVLIVLSESAIKSDWVQHEVRKARELAQEIGRHVLCPVALDDSWKNSLWPERVMEKVKEYNILDFSAWRHDVKFEGMFRKLIDGLQLFYKG